MLFGGLEMSFCGGWVGNKISLVKKDERGLFLLKLTWLLFRVFV